MPRNVTEIPPVPADDRVRYGDDPNHFFDLWNSAGTPRGAAIMIHGGFWRARYDLAHASHLCAALATNGLSVANLEYRRVGNPGGGWPGTFNDIIAGVRIAVSHLGHPEKTVVLGHSAGGHLALRLASEPLPIRGVVPLAPAADLRLAYDLHLSDDAVVEFLGGTPAQVPATYAEACPMRHTPLVPCTLLHGTSDEVVPISLSQSYVQKKKADEKLVSLQSIPDTGHFELIDPESPAFALVLASVLELLA